MTNKIFNVVGMNGNELEKRLMQSEMNRYLIPKAKASIYHHKNSTFIISEGIQKCSGKPYQGTFKLLTEYENEKNAIEYIKDITRCEVEEM